MKHALSKLLRRATVLLAVALGAIGIASGGGGATGTGYVAYGLLHDFGSIFVNGIEFFIDKAAITVNGVPNRSQSDLKLGMVLTVTGSLDGSGKTGTGDTVVYQADAIGSVDRVADATGTFSVLGQDVTVDARTVFAGFLAIADLQVGDAVEVSGFRSPSGLLAARVERLGSIPNVQVQGSAANVAATTFTLGSLTVDYSHAALRNIAAGGIANGQTVVARGPAPSAGVLAATEIDGVQAPSGNSNGSSSGVIAAIGANAIVLNGQTFVLTSNTQYVNGNAASLVAGQQVKVDYAVVSPTLVATRVEIVQLQESAQVEADVTARTASTLEVLGPNGVTITVSSTTQYKDSSGGHGGSTFSLAQANVGDHIVVRGNQVGDSTVLADRIERTTARSSINIEARALSAQAPYFTLLDRAIAVDPATDLRDETGAPVTPATFFAKVAGHDVTLAAVRRANGSLAATAVRMDY